MLNYFLNDSTISKLRMGYGFDSHPFLSAAEQFAMPERPLVLGGVRIPYDRSLQGHSDSDVVIHAVIDALLGAAALGDIGQHFPDTQTTLKNIDSRILLREIKTKLKAANFSINNIDITLMAHRPKLAPYREAMCQHLAEDLDLQPSQISVKFTTNNGLGFVGRQEGIAAAAVVLMRGR